MTVPGTALTRWLQPWNWGETWLPDEDMEDMFGKVVIVTGANSGVGYHITEQLAERRARVILAVRRVNEGNRAAGKIRSAIPHAKLEVMELNLASFESIKQFATDFKHRNYPLHVLINNASEFCPAPHRRTEEGLELTIGTNFFGTAFLTMQLMDVLARNAPSRVVMQASLLHTVGTVDLDHLTGIGYSGVHAYGSSKLMVMMWAKELARRVTGEGIDVFITHPGYANTNISSKRQVGRFIGGELFAAALTLPPSQTPRCAARSALFAASDPHIKGRGGRIIGPNVLNMYATCRRWAYNVQFYNRGNCHRLFELAQTIMARHTVPLTPASHQAADVPAVMK